MSVTLHPGATQLHRDPPSACSADSWTETSRTRVCAPTSTDGVSSVTSRTS